MKNTEKKVNIKQKNILRNKVFIGGVGVFALLSGITINKLKSNDIIEGEEKYGYYSSIYLSSIQNLDLDYFDNDFIRLYKKDKYLIGNKEYLSSSVYIVKNKDASVYLIKAGENTTDILTDQEKEYDRESICLFKDSTVFYNMYANGLIDKEMKLDPVQIQSYIQKWDGKKHDKTPELYAEKKASEAFAMKYGR